MARWLKKNFVTVLLVAVFIVGLGLIAYPSVSDYWNSFHQTRAIMSYSEEISKMDTSEYDHIIASAERYNQELGKRGFNWFMTDEEKEAYREELSFNSSGNMGYINIPKIDVMLPMYHGTSESVLQQSIGHLEETSLPVGGENSHCVLSGHRGLPSARLFTDLDKLVVGDTWTLTVLNETLTYEVDQVRVVEPTDIAALQLARGMDYCTLVTCTPYGINTHRLLVRGHRIENAQGEARVVADAIQIDSAYVAPYIAVPILLLLMITALIWPRRKRVKVDRTVISGKRSNGEEL